MSKRPISYTVPTTPERPAKRRMISSSSSFSGYQQAPEPMDLDEEEVTSTLKRKHASDRQGSDKYIAPTTWGMTVKELGIPEPDSKGFVHPYVAPKGEKRKAPEYSPSGSIINPTKGERPSKQLEEMTWTQQVKDLGIPEPDSRGFVHPYTPPPPPQEREIVPGVPEPSTAGYKMYSKSKMATTYKYLHVDSSNRLTHETNSKLMVNFGGLPIENCRRVAVLKCAITNTHHNVYQNHDSIELNVRLSTGENRVKLTIAHDYYEIAEIVTAFNAQLQAYTNGNSTLQTAVRDLEFVVVDEKVKVKVKDTPATVANTAISYSLIMDHRTDHPNSLLMELGFDKTFQTFDPSRYADYMNENLHDTSHYGTIILPAQNFYGRLFYQPNSGDSRPTSLLANHRYVIENAKGFYLCSSDLTAGGNVLKTQILGNGRASVSHDDHLLFIPNKAGRDEYNLYETNVLEWIDTPGDIQNFDLEIRTHSDKVLYSTTGSSAPPFLATLIFECETDKAVFGTDTLAYHREAYREAHQQN